MDPQATLQELRWALEELGETVETEDSCRIEDSLGLVQEHFRNLDDWLRKGGALPDEWSRD